MIVSIRLRWTTHCIKLDFINKPKVNRKLSGTTIRIEVKNDHSCCGGQQQTSNVKGTIKFGNTPCKRLSKEAYVSSHLKIRSSDSLIIEVKVRNRMQSKRSSAPAPKPPKRQIYTPVNPMAKTVYSKFGEQKFDLLPTKVERQKRFPKFSGDRLRLSPAFYNIMKNTQKTFSVNPTCDLRNNYNISTPISSDLCVQGTKVFNPCLYNHKSLLKFAKNK